MQYIDENWRRLFIDVILERGEDYYERCLVSRAERQDCTVKALVRGTALYEVELTLVGGELREAFCTCPYAEDGNLCKHMAAVCLAVEDGAIPDAEECREERSAVETLEQAVKNLTAEQAKDLLLRVASWDDEIRSRITTAVTGHPPEGDKAY